MEKSDPLYVTYVIDQRRYDITFAQQDFIKKEVDSNTIKALMRKAYGDDTLDERSVEFYNIKRYVAKIKKSIEPVTFTEDQIKFIEGNSHSMNGLELTKNVFPEREIKALSNETKTVGEYLKAIGGSAEGEEGNDGYKPPKAVSSLVRKINSYIGNASWNPNDLTPFQRKCVEALKGYLQSARFISFMNSCPGTQDKLIMEEEFVRGVYDKYDLNSEELNMYVTLCLNYVIIDQVTKSKLMLEDKINNVLSGNGNGGQGEKLYMTWVDAANQKATELNQRQTAAKGLAEALSANRATRLKSEAQNNESLSKFVEQWKSEVGRARALRIAEIQDRRVKEEVERIESMDDYIASVFGVSSDEITKF